ncbi:MAG TPA: helix-turn-helix domain-containing protein [Candidatus Angelobacter sp.]|nr:helix-turn-helix domain-containing protein [Candidatus Angelobacter sp.]
MTIDDYVVDVLMRDLVAHDRRTASFLIYLWMTFEAARRRRERVAISYQIIADSVGISKSTAQAGVRWLLKRKLIEASKTSATSTPTYRVLRPWRN